MLKNTAGTAVPHGGHNVDGLRICMVSTREAAKLSRKLRDTYGVVRLLMSNQCFNAEKNFRNLISRGYSRHHVI